MVGAVALLVLVVAPVLIGLGGAWRARRVGREPSQPWHWRVTVASALLYTLAFNLTFFIQEFFLVLPKALIPGLRPTLYHNNHRWEGTHPLAGVFQGTGALAILACAAVCALAQPRARRPGMALFLIWIVFQGTFQGLLQVVIGAVHPGNDVGMAFAALEFSRALRITLACLACAAMPLAAAWVAARLMAMDDRAATPPSSGSRARLVFLLGTLPAMLAIAPILAYRVPRELVEVIAPPLVVTLVGATWVQAWAWHIRAPQGRGGATSLTIAVPLTACIALLLFFQVLLRPGVRFY